MKHVIHALMENRPGVLARIVGVISGRGYNIESIHVDPTQDPSISRMTLVIPGDDRVLEQVTCQLERLVDVIQVGIRDIPRSDAIANEERSRDGRCTAPTG